MSLRTVNHNVFGAANCSLILNLGYRHSVIGILLRRFADAQTEFSWEPAEREGWSLGLWLWTVGARSFSIVY